MVTKPQQFVHYFAAWSLAALAILTLLEALSLELYFVVSLIGLLVITELTTPFNTRPEWYRRLRWLIVIGLAVFGYIVVRRILEILPN